MHNVIVRPRMQSERHLPNAEIRISDLLAERAHETSQQLRICMSNDFQFLVVGRS